MDGRQIRALTDEISRGLKLRLQAGRPPRGEQRIVLSHDPRTDNIEVQVHTLDSGSYSWRKGRVSEFGNFAEALRFARGMERSGVRLRYSVTIEDKTSGRGVRR